MNSKQTTILAMLVIVALIATTAGYALSQARTATYVGEEGDITGDVVAITLSEQIDMEYSTYTSGSTGSKIVVSTFGDYYLVPFDMTYKLTKPQVGNSYFVFIDSYTLYFSDGSRQISGQEFQYSDLRIVTGSQVEPYLGAESAVISTDIWDTLVTGQTLNIYLTGSILSSETEANIAGGASITRMDLTIHVEELPEATLQFKVSDQKLFEETEEKTKKDPMDFYEYSGGMEIIAPAGVTSASYKVIHAEDNFHFNGSYISTDETGSDASIIGADFTYKERNVKLAWKNVVSTSAQGKNGNDISPKGVADITQSDMTATNIYIDSDNPYIIAYYDKSEPNKVHVYGVSAGSGNLYVSWKDNSGVFKTYYYPETVTGDAEDAIKDLGTEYVGNTLIINVGTSPEVVMSSYSIHTDVDGSNVKIETVWAESEQTHYSVPGARTIVVQYNSTSYQAYSFNIENSFKATTPTVVSGSSYYNERDYYGTGSIDLLSGSKLGQEIIKDGRKYDNTYGGYNIYWSILKTIDGSVSIDANDTITGDGIVTLRAIITHATDPTTVDVIFKNVAVVASYIIGADDNQLYIAGTDIKENPVVSVSSEAITITRDGEGHQITVKATSSATASDYGIVKYIDGSNTKFCWFEVQTTAMPGVSCTPATPGGTSTVMPPDGYTLTDLLYAAYAGITMGLGANQLDVASSVPSGQDYAVCLVMEKDGALYLVKSSVTVTA